MPAERVAMRKNREVLRLHFACGLSKRRIAPRKGAGTSTMREHIDRATMAVLGWSLPEALDDEALKGRRFLPQSDLPDDRPMPTMLRHPTAARFEALGFQGMAGAFDEQIADAAMADLGFEDRFVLVSDRESA